MFIFGCDTLSRLPQSHVWDPVLNRHSVLASDRVADRLSSSAAGAWSSRTRKRGLLGSGPQLTDNIPVPSQGQACIVAVSLHWFAVEQRDAGAALMLVRFCSAIGCVSSDHFASRNQEPALSSRRGETNNEA